MEIEIAVEIEIIPRSVEFDDDELVFTDSVREIGVIQSQHELLRLSSFFSGDHRRQIASDGQNGS